MIDKIGLSLLCLLQKEYGNEYHEGHSADKAAKAMQDANPHLAQCMPQAAIAALRINSKLTLMEGSRSTINKIAENHFESIGVAS